MSHDHGGAAIEAAVSVLTVSDTRTPDNDSSGDRARRLIEAAGHRVIDSRIVPDEPEQIRPVVHAWLSQEHCDVVITTGGTGIASRDRTFEALDRLIDQRLEGFGGLFRMLSFEQVGSAAMLTRAMGGIARGKPLFVLPGSPAAVELALERLILPELGHLIHELRR